MRPAHGASCVSFALPSWFWIGLIERTTRHTDETAPDAKGIPRLGVWCDYLENGRCGHEYRLRPGAAQRDVETIGREEEQSSRTRVLWIRDADRNHHKFHGQPLHSFD